MNIRTKKKVAYISYIGSFIILACLSLIFFAYTEAFSNFNLADFFIIDFTATVETTLKFIILIIVFLKIFNVSERKYKRLLKEQDQKYWEERAKE